MRVEYSGKNISLTESLKNKAEAKLRKLERFTGQAASAHVSLEVERHLHRVDLVVQCSHDRTYKARSSAEDMYVAISDAADAIELQARKDKEKRIAGRGRRAEAAAEEGPEEEEPPAGARPPTVARRQDLYLPKPMSMRDALLILEERRAPALVFTETASRRLTVLIREKKGRFVAIEPGA